MKKKLLIALLVAGLLTACIGLAAAQIPDGENGGLLPEPDGLPQGDTESTGFEGIEDEVDGNDPVDEASMDLRLMYSNACRTMNCENALQEGETWRHTERHEYRHREGMNDEPAGYRPDETGPGNGDGSPGKKAGMSN